MKNISCMQFWRYITYRSDWYKASRFFCYNDEKNACTCANTNKSSIKNIDLNEVEAGLQLQLLTYVDAICKKEKTEPAGALYFSLIEPIIKSSEKLTEEQIEEEIKTGRINDQIGVESLICRLML